MAAQLREPGTGAPQGRKEDSRCLLAPTAEGEDEEGDEQSGEEDAVQALSEAQEKLLGGISDEYETTLQDMTGYIERLQQWRRSRTEQANAPSEAAVNAAALDDTVHQQMMAEYEAASLGTHASDLRSWRLSCEALERAQQRRMALEERMQQDRSSSTAGQAISNPRLEDTERQLLRLRLQHGLTLAHSDDGANEGDPVSALRGAEERPETDEGEDKPFAFSFDDERMLEAGLDLWSDAQQLGNSLEEYSAEIAELLRKLDDLDMPQANERASVVPQ
eukprot:scaffold1175_cov248-Pinguiococcus_pyrenoidosus.AAC.2